MYLLMHDQIVKKNYITLDLRLTPSLENSYATIKAWFFFLFVTVLKSTCWSLYNFFQYSCRSLVFFFLFFTFRGVWDKNVFCGHKKIECTLSAYITVRCKERLYIYTTAKKMLYYVVAVYLR